jgi:hypothetical protein
VLLIKDPFTTTGNLHGGGGVTLCGAGTFDGPTDQRASTDGSKLIIKTALDKIEDTGDLILDTGAGDLCLTAPITVPGDGSLIILVNSPFPSEPESEDLVTQWKDWPASSKLGDKVEIINNLPQKTKPEKDDTAASAGEKLPQKG